MISLRVFQLHFVTDNSLSTSPGAKCRPATKQLTSIGVCRLFFIYFFRRGDQQEHRHHVSSHLPWFFCECFSCFLSRITFFPQHPQPCVGLHRLSWKVLVCANEIFAERVVSWKIASNCLATCNDFIASVSVAFHYWQLSFHITWSRV